MRIFLTLVAASLLAVSAQAQTNTDAADVWQAVEAQWNAEKNGDKRWIDNMLAEEFSGWPNSSPAPRSKSSTKLWNRFNQRLAKLVEHELYPLSIVVQGDMAVAHYLYTSATESQDGDIETSNGRFTDVLVRTDDGWKFLAWHGGDDPG